MPESAEEVAALRATLKKKRRKLKTLRARWQADVDAELSELRAELAHRENTIQELLTLRMFLRASLEWLKASVAESFPRYNSLLYTVMFSNFGMFVTTAFLDFQSEAQETSEASSRVFWLPYLVWFLAGAVGWGVDWYASRRNSIAKKLNTVQAATFGAFSAQSMRAALDPHNAQLLASTLQKSVDCTLEYKLGQNPP